jgi:hypothetical protein
MFFFFKGQNAPNKISAILHCLKNEIYDCISSSLKHASQFLCSGLKYVFQALFFIALVLGAIYVIWKYLVKMFILLLVCQTIIGSIPGISDYCQLQSENSGGNPTTLVLPIDSVIEKTVAIAERLSETDVSAPIKITEVKISLIDLKTNVLYSQIEETTKDQLIKQIEDMKSSAALTIDEIHKMLASFNGALSKMAFYTNNLFRVLTNKADGNKIELQFETYLENIESEVERIIHNADDVHLKLGMPFFC